MTFPSNSLPCCAPFSAEDFFKDSPWLNIPKYRRGEILIEPLHPRGGLLGGSPAGQDAPPKSKLASLAAARKKKENVNTQAIGSKETTSSVALLERLGTKLQSTKIEGPSNQPSSDGKKTGARSSDHLTKKYPKKQRQSLEMEPKQQDQDAQKVPSSESPIVEESPKVIPAPAARPSTFAQTIFGPSESAKSFGTFRAQSPYVYPAHTQAETKNDPFAGPSPDDVVIKAQTSKGSIRSGG